MHLGTSTLLRPLQLQAVPYLLVSTLLCCLLSSIHERVRECIGVTEGEGRRKGGWERPIPPYCSDKYSIYFEASDAKTLKSRNSYILRCRARFDPLILNSQLLVRSSSAFFPDVGLDYRAVTARSGLSRKLFDFLTLIGCIGFSKCLTVL